MIVTTWVVVAGPLHPAALAVMVVVPTHPAEYVTAPVAATIVLPPINDIASRLYIIPVEFAADVVVVTFPAPWQRVDVAGAKALMITVGVMVTTCVVVTGPLHPAALAVMVVDPLQPAA